MTIYRKSRFKRYRQILAVLSALVAISAFGIHAGASEDFSKKQSPVMSASEIDYPPFCFIEKDGRPNGFSVELLTAALKSMGREVTFRSGPWTDVKEWLEQGEVHALPLVGRTPERELSFDFTFSYLSLHGAIVVRQGTTGIRDLGDLRGRQVAVMQGDNAEEFLRRENRGIEIHTTATFGEALRRLSQGRYDAVVVQRLVALRLIQATGLENLTVVNQPIEGFQQDFCFAVSEGDRETLALLNEGLSLVIADGTYRHLHAKWFATLELPSDRRIVVGGDHNFPPFEFLDKNGQPAGYNVDLTRAIAQATGLDIEIRLGPWAEIRQELAKDGIDAIQGMLYSTERDVSFDFTPPHTAIQYVSVIRKGDGDPPATAGELAGRGIVLQDGDIMHGFAVANGLMEKVSVVDNQEDALRELSEGKHDCALVARLAALYWINKHGWANLTIGRRPLLTPGYCYAVALNHKALLAQLGEGLKILDENGGYRRIYEKWLGIYNGPPSGLVPFLRYTGMILIPLALLILVFSLWSWYLRKQVGQRTRELAKMQTILNETGKMGKIGGWEHDLSTGKTFWTEALYDIIGIPYDQEPPGVADHLSYYPLRYQNILERAYSQAIEDRTQFDLELEVFTSSKKRIWCRVQGKSEFENDQCVKMRGTFQEITARKRAEEALIESVARHRALVDTIPDLVWLKDQDGVYLSCNPTFERFFGAKESAIVGKTDYDFVDKGLADFFRAHDRKAMAAGRPSINEERLTFADNGYHGLFETIKSPMRDADGNLIGVLGIARDISEREKTKTALKESEQRYKSAQRMGQVGNWEYDLATEKFWGSDQAKRIYGFDPASNSYTTDDVENCIPERERVHQALIDLIEQNKPYDIEFEIQPVAGFAQKTIRSIAEIAFDDNGAAQKVVGVIQDITQQKAAEKEKILLERQLKQSQKMESIGTLAGGIAHDFNNILSSVIGFTELALDGAAKGTPMADNLQEVYTAGKRARDLVKQILAFARQSDPERKPIQVDTILKEVLKLMRSTIPTTIEIKEKIESHSLIMGNSTQIHQLFLNLCTNAAQAMEGAGGILEVGTTDVELNDQSFLPQSDLKSGHYIKVTVSDTGHGIPQDIIGAIFEPYFTTRGVGEGTGMGLAMVHGIVETYDGNITVNSALGKGAVFEVYLPILKKHAVIGAR